MNLLSDDQVEKVIIAFTYEIGTFDATFKTTFQEKAQIQATILKQRFGSVDFDDNRVIRLIALKLFYSISENQEVESQEIYWLETSLKMEDENV